MSRMNADAARTNETARLDYHEEELVKAAQQGDRAAFAMLYEANVDRVYHYLLGRMGQSADAEDVTTEVFIRAMRALQSYKSQGTPFVAWLFRIAHNQAVNHHKKQTRRRELPLLDMVNAADDPEEKALRHIASDEVLQAMDGLTDLQRQVISLRFGAQLSIAETAKTMNRTEEATKFLQHSALRALRRLLSPQEIGSHARPS